MHKKAIILDLDNTIYPVSSIAHKLFPSLFALIEESGAYKGDLAEIKYRIMRQPFQLVAKDFSFSPTLTSQCQHLLSQLTYNDKMEPFESYGVLKTIPAKKFLVTTGFPKLQHSKIKQLGIEKDFEAIFVIDPDKTNQTKKDVFQQILADHGFSPEEVLVVGDDLESEIKAAKELGIAAVLYNHNGAQPEVEGQDTIHTFDEIYPFVK